MNEIAESYGCSMFCFFEEPPYIFHSGCTNLHSYQQYTKDSLLSTL